MNPSLAIGSDCFLPAAPSVADWSKRPDPVLPFRDYCEVGLVVDVAKTGCLGLGLRSRTERVGPEADLIDDFLNEVSFTLAEGQRAFILKEPQIGQSFPDVVVVVYDTKKMESWPSNRRELMTDDLKLIQLILTNRGATESELKMFLGRTPSKGLERLCAAGMIVQRNLKWQTCDLSNIFALSSVLSFEAKMSPTFKVLEQALANKWFATNSAILIPSIGQRSRIVDAARKNDLSVYSRQVGKKITIRPRRYSKPLSYASWVINEWAWRMTSQ